MTHRLLATVVATLALSASLALTADATPKDDLKSYCSSQGGTYKVSNGTKTCTVTTTTTTTGFDQHVSPDTGNSDFYIGAYAWQLKKTTRVVYTQKANDPIQTGPTETVS